MKQVGNLAIVVANHPKAMMQIYDGDVSVYIGEGTERKTISCNVWDDAYINAIIAHLNFGTELKGDKTYANS
ncbi:MAG TPA: hypothetical protein DEP65_05105 [Ruminococcus sp.]|nr:hypothetical protein [Ruminococcus sp.]